MKPVDFTDLYDDRAELLARIENAQRKSCEKLGKPYVEPNTNPIPDYKERVKAAFEESQRELPTDEFGSIRQGLERRGARPKKASVHKANHNKRTVEYWKGLGFHVHDVQWHDRILNRSHDLMGFGDYLALKAGQSAILIQVTSKEHESDHVAKIKGLRAAQQWLDSGNRIVLSLWKKKTTLNGAISYAYSECEIV